MQKTAKSKPDALLNYWGLDTFTYRANDGQADSNLATVSITIAAVNDPPTAASDHYVVAEDGVLIVDATLGVLANDTDSDNDILIATVVTLPEHGILKLNADGGFSYSAGLGCDAVNDSFTYLASDGNGGTTTATVTITISYYVGVSVDGTILHIGGGEYTDIITVNSAGLTFNDTLYSLAGITEIRVWSRGGDDRIDLSGLSVPAFVDGGEGNDTVTGGSADDVFVGGLGDDHLTGAAGDDLLVGGSGRDRLVGSAGNDILAADDINCAFDLLGLRAISLAWSRSRTAYDNPVDDLFAELQDDGALDQLTGGAGADLFILSLGDRITDFQFGKPKSNKDGDVVVLDGEIIS